MDRKSVVPGHKGYGGVDTKKFKGNRRESRRQQRRGGPPRATKRVEQRGWRGKKKKTGVKKAKQMGEKRGSAKDQRGNPGPQTP